MEKHPDEQLENASVEEGVFHVATVNEKALVRKV